MKVATIVGVRPEFIKMPIVTKEFRRLGIEEVIIHTGQHYDYEMDKIFFEQLKIPEPHYNLGIGSGTHGYQTGEMLKKIEEVLIKEKPEIVIVYGDTNSTLAGALAATKIHIQVAHVEAGLRCFDKKMPEEINRILTDRISDYLFAPTERAVKNLEREGITSGVYFVGDVMLDVAIQNIKFAEKSSKILESIGLKKKEYILATIHRAENTDNRENLKRIVEAFVNSAEKIVLPIHPRTRKMLAQYLL
ncbi:MAG: UDP-N-acetylglucosamine 2-epimerase (non-hydrolyzing), partial [Leptospiraceae bacterium]|nr:UDP-N-acetylglucosamine 2-epimerase (non-hydrolyzing) [Leptospiraceae bacterium]